MPNNTLTLTLCPQTVIRLSLRSTPRQVTGADMSIYHCPRLNEGDETKVTNLIKKRLEERKEADQVALEEAVNFKESMASSVDAGVGAGVGAAGSEGAGSAATTAPDDAKKKAGSPGKVNVALAAVRRSLRPGTNSSRSSNGDELDGARGNRRSPKSRRGLRPGATSPMPTDFPPDHAPPLSSRMMGSAESSGSSQGIKSPTSEGLRSSNSPPPRPPTPSGRIPARLPPAELPEGEPPEDELLPEERM